MLVTPAAERIRSSESYAKASLTLKLHRQHSHRLVSQPTASHRQRCLAVNTPGLNSCRIREIDGFALERAIYLSASWLP